MHYSYRFWRKAQVIVALLLALTLCWRFYAGRDAFHMTGSLMIVLLGVSYAAGRTRKRERE